MRENDFLNCVENLLEAKPGTLALSDRLENIEGFDSMTMIGIITWAEANGLAISLEELADIHDLNDIFLLLNK